MPKPSSIRRPARPAAKTPAPKTAASPSAGGQTKLQLAINLISRPEGASLDELVKATGWQRHSTRGALAGALRKKLGGPVTVEIIDGLRRYHAPKSGAEV